MYDSILYDIKIILKSCFLYAKLKILPYVCDIVMIINYKEDLT